MRRAEGSQGNKDGRVTLDEWIKYYEEVSCSIDSDDYFGTMLATTWSHLKKKGSDGSTGPVVKVWAARNAPRACMRVSSTHARPRPCDAHV